MFNEIKKCRLSNSSNLTSVLNLGNQCFTGIFPRSRDQHVSQGPLELVCCKKDSNLIQLRHSFPIDEMYGENYGYRSGLNQSMVNHLKRKVEYLESIILLESDDLVLDIGSNDATTLKAYSKSDIIRVGIDPAKNIHSELEENCEIMIGDFC